MKRVYIDLLAEFVQCSYDKVVTGNQYSRSQCVNGFLSRNLASIAQGSFCAIVYCS